MELQNPVLNGMNNAVQRDTNRNNNLFSALIAHAQHNNAQKLQQQRFQNNWEMIDAGVNPFNGAVYNDTDKRAIEPFVKQYGKDYRTAATTGTSSAFYPHVLTLPPEKEETPASSPRPAGMPTMLPPTPDPSMYAPLYGTSPTFIGTTPPVKKK